MEEQMRLCIRLAMEDSGFHLHTSMDNNIHNLIIVTRFPSFDTSARMSSIITTFISHRGRERGAKSFVELGAGVPNRKGGRVRPSKRRAREGEGGSFVSSGTCDPVRPAGGRGSVRLDFRERTNELGCRPWLGRARGVRELLAFAQLQEQRKVTGAGSLLGLWTGEDRNPERGSEYSASALDGANQGEGHDRERGVRSLLLPTEGNDLALECVIPFLQFSLPSSILNMETEILPKACLYCRESSEHAISAETKISFNRGHRCGYPIQE
ncbi:hypothetical protein M5K25_003276 [Dendrobium thyrsiflorum]|uniref:Uncharacterized protein n=1 Tax=Dendrobium thyrsiflorum TaxID=117978 RepID=A0ABD0VIL0_DENTH